MLSNGVSVSAVQQCESDIFIRGFKTYISGASLVTHTVKNPPAMEETGSIPGLGRSPGEENGYPFQYSYLENSMDRRAWWATVHGVAKSQT